jgi:hypothetical protein
MNWFSKIFSNKTDNRNHGTDPASVQDATTLQGLTPAITEDLFVDNQAPEVENETGKDTGISIRAFLEQDFNGSGYKDGYNYHSVEMKNNRIKSLKATFRFQLDLSIEEKRQALLQLRTHNIDFEGLSERMTRRITAVEEEQKSFIARLEKEKELSVEEEGWIMKPIHEYRDGFLRGADAYNEEKILAGSTGMFNF